MAETDTQNETDCGSPVVVCDLRSSSLKSGLKLRFREFGFSTLSDGLRTVARDIVAGRIEYRAGMIQRQEKIA